MVGGNSSSTRHSEIIFDAHPLPSQRYEVFKFQINCQRFYEFSNFRSIDVERERERDTNKSGSKII